MSEPNNDQTLFCLNDQGGNVMGVSHDVAGTLRAQEHGHQPAVMTFDTTQIISVLDMNRQTPRTYQVQNCSLYTLLWEARLVRIYPWPVSEKAWRGNGPACLWNKSE